MSICNCYLENKEADEYVTGGGKTIQKMEERMTNL